MKALMQRMWMIMALTLAALADDVVISSFDRPGQIVFNTVSNARGYRIEWARMPMGPWTNFMEAAINLDNISGYSGGMITCTVPMLYRVVATISNTIPSPESMVLIPSGEFVMGDTFGEGDANEWPRHTNYLSPFYLGKYEVTKAKWDEVRMWALANGYWFNQGAGKSTNHPVQMVNWYDAAKWCNALSQKEGLSPCYTTNGGVYRTGNSIPDCNWMANGYRMPTEAEWEKAARGGVAEARFPWLDFTNKIAHAKANYRGYSETYSYDLSSGYHPLYSVGEVPYTSPVGSFEAYGYGLYDMAGNVREWCWDWHDDDFYGISPWSDPHGPTTGDRRALRGGDWNRGAFYCRVADRNDEYYALPYFSENFIGFRIARTALP